MSRRKSKQTPTAASKVSGGVLVRVPVNTLVRNPVAANPLLGKSQAHGKTRKANRRADKVSLSKMSFERIACGAIELGQKSGQKSDQALGSNDIFKASNRDSAESGAAALAYRLAA